MDNDIFSGIVWAAALLGILISFCLAQWRRRQHTKRLLIRELLKRYFQNDVPANELRSRIREISNYFFMHSTDLFALVIAAFQRAVDEKLAHEENFKEDERKLLSQLAVLKRELGLTDLYQIEGWRAWRE